MKDAWRLSDVFTRLVRQTVAMAAVQSIFLSLVHRDNFIRNYDKIYDTDAIRQRISNRDAAAAENCTRQAVPYLKRHRESRCCI